MSPYEIADRLLQCADELDEAEFEFRYDGHLEYANLVQACRLSLGKAFNELRTHAFSLPVTPEQVSDKSKGELIYDQE